MWYNRVKIREGKTPNKKGYIIMKNINEMNREELDRAIAEIENDPKYISARMADRLEGEEKAYYNKQFNTLLELNRARANKRTKEEYEELLANTLETLSNLYKSLAEDKLDAFRKYTLKQTIASFEKTAENYRRRIAEAE